MVVLLHAPTRAYAVTGFLRATKQTIWHSDRMTGRDEGSAPCKSAGVGNATQRVSGTGGRSRDASWVRWVALLPVIVLGVSIPTGLFLANSGTVVGDVVATWMLLGIFGLVIFVPVTTLSLLGAAVFDNRNVRVGRWFASVGAVAATVFYAYLAFVVIEEAAVPEMRDPNSWNPQLTPVTALLVVVPYIAGAAGNVYVVGRLWRQARPSTPVPTAA